MVEVHPTDVPLYIEVFLTNSCSLGEQTDEDIYLAVRLIRQTPEKKTKEKDYAIIPLPATEFGRFIRLPDSEGKIHLMFLDDVFVIVYQ